MFKSLKHGKDIALRILFVMKMFWSFGFVLLGIVSNFVLRYSDFSPAKENDYVGPFPGPSSSHRFYRWSLTSLFGHIRCHLPVQELTHPRILALVPQFVGATCCSNAFGGSIKDHDPVSDRVSTCQIMAHDDESDA